jgi:hypothetical protein
MVAVLQRLMTPCLHLLIPAITSAHLITTQLSLPFRSAVLRPLVALKASMAASTLLRVHIAPEAPVVDILHLRHLARVQVRQLSPHLHLATVPLLR